MRHTVIAALLAAAALPANAQTLPDHAARVVTDLGLTDVRWHPGRERADMDADLAGSSVEIDFHRDGALDEIEAHRTPFPLSSITPLLPEGGLTQSMLPPDALIEKVEFDDTIEMKGRLASGAEFEAEFDHGGALREMEIKD